jgi:GT2 family glycosyltransferase
MIKNVAIAICTYRRFDMLSQCLDSIKKQSSSLDDINIIIVDNSIQPNKSIDFRDSIEGIPNMQYFITDKSGLSFARNFALEKCENEYIAFIDDDSFLHKDWLNNLKFLLSSIKERVGVIGGKVLPVWLAERPKWLSDKMLTALTILDWGDEEFEITDFDKHWLVGANIIYNLNAIKQVGGFSEKLGRNEDSLMCHEELDSNLRLHKAGFKIIYSPKIKVDHFVYPNRLTQSYFSELMYSEGLSKAVLRNSDKDITSDLSYCDDFLNSKKISEKNVFNDTDVPELFERKMMAISKLGRLIAQSKKIIEKEVHKEITINEEKLSKLNNENEKLKAQIDKLTQLTSESLEQQVKLNKKLLVNDEKLKKKDLKISEYNDMISRLIKENDTLKEFNTALMEDNAFYKAICNETNNTKKADVRNRVLGALQIENAINLKY